MTDKKMKIGTGNVLMDLRLAILRAISEVWEDDAKDENDVVKELLTKTDEPRTLAWLHQYADSHNEEFSLRNFLTSAPIPVLNLYFKYMFGYSAPFANFGVYFIPGNAVWNLFGDNSWSKPQEETITLTLPSAEPEWDEYEQTFRLMEYYSYFPDFFGSVQLDQDNQPFRAPQGDSVATTGNVESASDGVIADDVFDNVASMALSAVNSDMGGNDYDLGVSQDTFLGFGAVISKLIAVAWNNAQFKNIVDYDARRAAWEANPKGVSLEDFEANYFSQMIRILTDHFEFNFPWAFQIKFVFAETSEESGQKCAAVERKPSKLSYWFKQDGEWQWRWDNKNGSPYLLRNVVSLEIPLTPDANESNVSLALARYNAIGPAYPFTCS